MEAGTDYKFDIAISYAREARGFAELVERWLRRRGMRVYRDESQQLAELGEDLQERLREVYSDLARHCLVILSNEYLQRRWTRFELDVALETHKRRRDIQKTPYLIAVSVVRELPAETPDSLRDLVRKDLARIPTGKRMSESIRFITKLAEKIDSRAGQQRRDQVRLFLARLCEPRASSIGVFFVTFVWVVFGLVSHFDSTEPDVPWTRDFMGHWLIGQSAVFLLLLRLSFGHLGTIATSSHDMWFVADYTNSVNLERWAAIVVLCASAFTLGNIQYVLASRTLWTEAVGGTPLVSLVAFAYYFGATAPLMLFMRRYAIYLEIVTTRCRDLELFSPHVRGFGLASLANLIVVPAFVGILMMFPAVPIQVHMHGDVTLGNIAMVAVSCYILNRLAIQPLTTIYATLQKVKIELITEINAKLRGLEGVESDVAVERRLELTRERQRIEEVETFLGDKRLIVGGLAILLGSILYPLVRSVFAVAS